MSVRIITGDAVEQLRLLPAESVHCCVTSPPYYGLRDYGVAGQLGLEATPDEYVAAMVGVFREVRRVLRADGTLWLNIGDSYHNYRVHKDGGQPPQGFHNDRHGQPESGGRNRGTHLPGLKEKDIIGVPWMLAFALRVDGWWLRSEIIWHKPNPMPESVTDRPTKSHEQIFLLSKSPTYYYDAEAIKEPLTPGSAERYEYAFGGPKTDSLLAHGLRTHPSGYRVLGGKGQATPTEVRSSAGSRFGRGAGWRDDPSTTPPQRNKRSVWTIATAPFPEAHFATFPPALVEPCILAGCPRGGTVLDPFGGAGTTALVADRLGRDAILIELNPAYAQMAKRRIEADAGLFANVAN